MFRSPRGWSIFVGSSRTFGRWECVFSALGLNTTRYLRRILLLDLCASGRADCGRIVLLHRCNRSLALSLSLSCAFAYLFLPIICIEYRNIGDYINGKLALHSRDTNRTRQIDSAITESEEVSSITDMRRNTREITAYVRVN